MTNKEMADRICALHDVWSRADQKMPFRHTLALKDHAAFIAIHKETNLLSALPAKIRRALGVPTGPKTGESVLKRYTPELTKKWLENNNGSSLQAFLESTARNHQTEDELREFLGLNR